jgi:hypothetical protein
VLEQLGDGFPAGKELTQMTRVGCSAMMSATLSICQQSAELRQSVHVGNFGAPFGDSDQCLSRADGA